MTSFMRQEIEQIPATIAGLLELGAPEAERTARAIERVQPRAVFIAARGTSDHAAIYARYLIETHLGIPVGLAAPSVTTIYGARLDWRGSLLVAISQSGAGPDIVAVAQAARAGGALTVAVTNEPGSPIAGAVDEVLLCHAGIERSVAATKTYVAQLAAIAALVARLAPDSGLPAALGRLPAALAAAVTAGNAWIEGPHSPVGAFAGEETSLVVSRGYNMATAFEIALKLKETGRAFAEGFSSADLMHGPLVLAAAPDVPVLVIRPDGRMGVAIDAGLAAVRELGARPWIVGGRDLRATDPTAGDPERTLVLNLHLPEALTPLAYVIPGQLAAEAVARWRGLDPDAPHGLHKVTRTH